MAVIAVQQIRRMRGGAQSHLMLGSDGHLYVVKFQNNPQHLRVLANELYATRLAEAVGLSVPATEVVEVSEWLVENTPELYMETAHQQERCAAGLQFGSRYVGGLMPGQVVDYLPEEQLAEVRNLTEFAGMLVVDKWTCNSNGRQAVFHRKPREKRYAANFVDQGYCFHAGEWSFPDAPLRGVYGRNRVYADVTGWASFEPWLSRVEGLEPDAVWQIAERASKLVWRRSAGDGTTDSDPAGSSRTSEGFDCAISGEFEDAISEMDWDGERGWRRAVRGAKKVRE